MPQLLIVEPDPRLRADLERATHRLGYRAQSVAAVDEALARADAQRFDAVILDVANRAQLADIGVLLPAAAPALIATGARSCLELALEARRLGARDFLPKPFALEALESALRAALAGGERVGRNARSARIVTCDPAMERLLQQAEAAARSEATVQIFGESGTGKDLLARFVHEHSRRRSGPFVVVNCAALPESLAESELFGHEAGAFTGANQARPGQVVAADGGTLLLDEISEASGQLQPKLLRVLQEREVLPLGALRPRDVDVRILATSQRDLMREVDAGRFRRDLYFRLDVIVLRLPPLRERADDLPLLARSFLERFARDQGCDTPQLDDAALARLARHAFRGNVRELENLMRRAVLLFPGQAVDADVLLRPRGSARRPVSRAADTLNLKELERRAILRCLEQTGGNRTLASRELGISVRTLRNKIRLYGLG